MEGSFASERSRIGIVEKDIVSINVRGERAQRRKEENRFTCLEREGTRYLKMV